MKKLNKRERQWWALWLHLKQQRAITDIAIEMKVKVDLVKQWVTEPKTKAKAYDLIHCRGVQTWARFKEKMGQEQ